MGCIQARPATDSPAGRSLDGLKARYGYAPTTAYTALKPPSDGDDAREEEDSRASLVEEEEELREGWPKWLVDNVPNKVLAGLVPKSADSYDKLDKIGQGTYSNVYKAQDKETGKIVALKKVRFDTSEPESIKFMAREITMLRLLDHPNILKLEGLATSRMQYSLYLVFDLMLSDLTRIISRPEKLTLPQIKSYMHQLLSGLDHCHGRGILHRDIKGSNLLIDKNGMLKIADFGLANFFDPSQKCQLTNRVVTLWYRAPELLLGATDYGAGIDLWSAGCLLAEMFSGRAIMPGRNEVEQLHLIFKLCGTPSEEYWKRLKLLTTFRPPKSYKLSIVETFTDLPGSALSLLKTLLSLDPAYRGSASSALQNEFFFTSPLACDLSDLPVIPNDDNELVRAKEEKKKRRSRMRRSRTHAAVRETGFPSAKPEDHVSSKEVKETENTAEPFTWSGKHISPTSSIASLGPNQAREKGTSSASTSNTSPASNPTGLAKSPLLSTSNTSTFGANPSGRKDSNTSPGENPSIRRGSHATRQRDSPIFSPSSSAAERTSVSSFSTTTTATSIASSGTGKGRFSPGKAPAKALGDSDANRSDQKVHAFPMKPQIRITNYSRDSSKAQRESQVHRSVSAREARGFTNPKEHRKGYDIDDELL